MSHEVYRFGGCGRSVEHVFIANWRLLAENHEISHGVVNPVDEMVEVLQLFDIWNALVAEFNDLIGHLFKRMGTNLPRS